VDPGATRARRLLRTIVAWAAAEPSIQALILTGSYARDDNSADELSDLDLEIYATDHEPYAASDGWMSALGTVWMYLPLPGRGGYPNRLVIYNGGTKVDFSLRPVAVLEELAARDPLPDLYERGYQMLIDKTGIAARLPKASGWARPATRPTQEQFTALVEEFWFETYHVGKYLRRGDLWAAKWRDWATKELLLRMIELYAHALHGWDHDTWHLGLNMRRWAEPDVWEDVHHVFAGLDAAESWRALEATMRLFRRLAQRAAELLGYRYPAGVDENLSRYTLGLR
jgi:aminoglycoside 6-adenylyltransferase